MSKLNAAALEYFDDVSEVERGDFLKHDVCQATRTLDVTQTDVDECPDLEEFLGMRIEQDGSVSYNWGWESYDDPVILRKVSREVPEVVIPAHTVVEWEVLYE